MQRIGNVFIDMYEQLPAPFGLVRFGVAPDHPEVKNCQDRFTEVAESPNFSFIGNVNLGNELPLELLKPHYDAFLFAYGASEDKELGLAGERQAKNIYSARAFVGWYNGLPAYRDFNPDLSKCEDVVIIGQGNVALDVARILLTDVDILRKTDITDYALDALLKSKVSNVRIVGRRGPIQAAFTIKEIRELMQLPSLNFSPIPSELLPPATAGLPRPKKRIVDLLRKGSQPPQATSPRKSWSLDFLLSPLELHFSPSDPTLLTSTTFTRTQLSEPLSPSSPVTQTSSTTTLPAQSLFRSIGYKSSAVPGFSSYGIPFHDRTGTIPNDGLGRIVSSTAKPSDGSVKPLPGLYCAGWVKRGPTGVIASTMEDAFATAEAIAADWRDGDNAAAFLGGEGDAEKKAGWEGVEQEVKRLGLRVRRVSWEDWKKIDRAERERGRGRGKEREKFGSVEEMLKVLD
ncbi:MAG: hypothetical protein Q9160_002868 [Pyrenula sp. 1 TL-2023]